MLKAVPDFLNKLNNVEDKAYNWSHSERDSFINDMISETKLMVQKNELKEIKSVEFAAKLIVK